MHRLRKQIYDKSNNTRTHEEDNTLNGYVISLQKLDALLKADIKKGLVRIVRSKDGEISLDPTGKKSGRGAYICNDRECFGKAVKKRSLEKALKCQIPAEIYDRLKELIGSENE